MKQTSFFLDTPDSLTFDLDSAKDKGYLTHNFHPYPAKFIPQIPAAILDHYARDRCVVLDPFCGSGTVAVEATIRGHYCIANDINPIATLVTRAKTLTLTDDDKGHLRRLLLRLAKREFTSAFLITPQFKNRELWFSSEMLGELTTIRGLIRTLPEDSNAAILALCAFSAIVVKCSNQESETHWRSVEKGLAIGFAIEAFSLKLSEMIERSVRYSELNRGSAKIITGNALLLSGVCDNSVDLIVTSPPYANSHDYYLYNKLRMFWLGYDHYPVQETEIGSRHRHSDLKEPLDVYLAEMLTALKEMGRVVKPGGAIAIVVGDSIFHSTLIDMGGEYTRVASEAALRKMFHYNFDQRKYTSAFQRGLKTTPKRSHILVFEK